MSERLERVYLAAGAEGVLALRDRAELEAPVYRVTPDMRAADPRADEEDLEYEACRAAEDDLREREALVVVVAADVPSTTVLDGDEAGGGAARLSAPVPGAAVVAFHVAEHGADADEELLWYDATEVDDVAAYLGL